MVKTLGDFYHITYFNSIGFDLILLVVIYPQTIRVVFVAVIFYRAVVFGIRKPL